MQTVQKVYSRNSWVGAYLCNAKAYLRAGQVLVLAGCFSGGSQDNAWVVTADGTNPTQISHNYTSNAQEADMHVWRHAI